MKIKTQLYIFVSILVIIPIFGLLSFFILQSNHSTKRLFQKSYEKITKQVQNELDDKDMELIQSAIKSLSSDVEASLIVQNTVKISTIPHFKEGALISDGMLWDIIRQTSQNYFYQFETPPLGTKENRTILVSRVSKYKKAKDTNFSHGILYAIFVLIAGCIFIAILISRAISTSITILDEHTKRIASGDLETPVKLSSNSTEMNEITSLCNNLEKMRQTLVDSNKMRSRFVMGISHDLRTPIAVIKGYTEAISDGVMSSPEDIQKAVSLITSKSNQLEAMIDTIINYEKLTSIELYNKLTYSKFKPFIEELAKNCVSTGTVFHKKVISSINLSDDTEILYDPNLATRAFNNIFSNALRYTKDNDTIEVRAEEFNDRIEIGIKDSGIGIEEEDKNHIFDLFYRGTNSRREEGMGIGLSVVKDILEIFRWKIDVQSTKNVGTEFTIIIPKKHTKKALEEIDLKKENLPQSK